MATITGTAGSDSLLGTAGTDDITGAGGVDTISAGAGDDIVHLTGTVPTGNLLIGLFDGGAGYDILDLSGWQGNLITDEGPNGTINLDQVELVNGSPVFTEIGHVSGFEEVHLGPGVFAFGFYQGGGDPNMLPAWKVVGSAGADAVYDGGGNDTIDTGAGNDFVGTRGGSDRVSLGDGNDTYSVDKLSGYFDHIAVDGGAGTDTLELNVDPGVDLSIDLSKATSQLGNTILSFTSFEAVEVTGSYAPGGSGHVALTGTTGADTLGAGGMADGILLGREGNDVLRGGLQGGATIYGGSGDDQISGGDGTDWINGGGHYAGDTVPAATADDGSDMIDGGSGNDHIWGNSEFAVQGAADGQDTIYGGDGMDYVNGNAGADWIYGGLGSDRLYGGAGIDVIYGDDYDPDNSIANGGNDHINGNKGDDFLYGGAGNDEILGGQGNDWIDGGDGVDTLSGDMGADTFVMLMHRDDALHGKPFLPDLIIDFDRGTDKLFTAHAINIVLHPGDATDYISAWQLAKSVIPVSDPTNFATAEDMAAIQVGSDTYLFWDNFGDGPESGFRLQDTRASLIEVGDF